MSHFIARNRGVLAAGIAVFIANQSFATNYYVDPTGVIPGSYTTINAALSGMPAGTAGNPSILNIKPGTYTEKLNVTKAYTAFVGMTTNPSDVVIQHNLNANSDNGAGSTVGTTGSTSTTISATDFTAKYVTFKNATPDNIAQAVAIKTTRDRMAFENCRFWGFQDTLYTTSGRNYFKNCYVTGDTDFIFGNATAVFDKCTINESGPSGYVTAANTSRTTAVGMVFLDCTLTGTPNTDINPLTNTRYSTVTSVTANASFLGRPWQYDSTKPASVTFVNTKIGPFIRTDGWHQWDANNLDPDGNSRYSEFGSMNAAGTLLALNASGVPNGRLSWADPMTATHASQYTIANIFGPASFWNNNPSFQPEYTGPYTNIDWGQGNDAIAWDPIAQLSSIPEPTVIAPIAMIATFAMRRRR